MPSGMSAREVRLLAAVKNTSEAILTLLRYLEQNPPGASEQSSADSRHDVQRRRRREEALAQNMERVLILMQRIAEDIDSVDLFPDLDHFLYRLRGIETVLSNFMVVKLSATHDTALEEAEAALTRQLSEMMRIW